MVRPAKVSAPAAGSRPVALQVAPVLCRHAVALTEDAPAPVQARGYFSSSLHRIPGSGCGSRAEGRSPARAGPPVVRLGTDPDAIDHRLDTLDVPDRGQEVVHLALRH